MLNARAVYTFAHDDMHHDDDWIRMIQAHGPFEDSAKQRAMKLVSERGGPDVVYVVKIVAVVKRSADVEE